MTSKDSTYQPILMRRKPGREKIPPLNIIKKWFRKSMVTQFEPTYARRAFPCFDEPSFKAEFHLSVVREAGNVVRSNMNLKKTIERLDG